MQCHRGENEDIIAERQRPSIVNWPFMHARLGVVQHRRQTTAAAASRRMTSLRKTVKLSTHATIANSRAR
jgi:hypothetical protein